MTRRVTSYICDARTIDACNYILALPLVESAVILGVRKIQNQVVIDYSVDNAREFNYPFISDHTIKFPKEDIPRKLHTLLFLKYGRPTDIDIDCAQYLGVVELTDTSSQEANGIYHVFKLIGVRETPNA
jgi:hypothetical protein